MPESCHLRLPLLSPRFKQSFSLEGRDFGGRSATSSTDRDFRSKRLRGSVGDGNLT